MTRTAPEPPALNDHPNVSVKPETEQPVSGSIEIRLEKLSQLFHSLDPYPFRERDLDRDAEEFIVDWARELPHNQPLSILVHLPKPEAESEHAAQVEGAVRRYFKYRAVVAAHDLKELFAVGRVYLLIGLTMLIACMAAAQLVSNLAGKTSWAPIVSEGFIILGWVANWRPAEIFLYDWWPMARRRRLMRRLSEASVALISR